MSRRSDDSLNNFSREGLDQKLCELIRFILLEPANDNGNKQIDLEKLQIIVKASAPLQDLYSATIQGDTFPLNLSKELLLRISQMNQGDDCAEILQNNEDINLKTKIIAAIPASVKHNLPYKHDTVLPRNETVDGRRYTNLSDYDGNDSESSDDSLGLCEYICSFFSSTSCSSKSERFSAGEMEFKAYSEELSHDRPRQAFDVEPLDSPLLGQGQ